MLLSVTTSHQPATDLGFLLHKHPDRLHEAELPFGRAFLFYPEATPARCTATLLLDVDPIGLVRGRAGRNLQDEYVNDRPYAASSFLSAALSRMLRTAMAGTSKDGPELAADGLPIEARVTPLPVRGGEQLVRELFEPLGWSVVLEPIEEPGGGAARHVDLRLRGHGRIADLLTHLSVLIPVLDDAKHDWVGEDEITKLLQKGAGWLERHPRRELIVTRTLANQRSLARLALARLLPEVAEATDAAPTGRRDTGEDNLEAPIRLHDQRLAAVAEALQAAGAKVIADLGCGGGKLLARLVRERSVERLIGVDSCARDLETAAKRLRLHEAAGVRDERVTLLHGALTYRDPRWSGVDAAVLMEVVEHLDPDRLPALQRVVSGEARPRTTPNADYNPLFPNLPPGQLRHPDHRFEWSGAAFRQWAGTIEASFGYTALHSGIGPTDPELGAPTQMAVFSR